MEEQIEIHAYHGWGFDSQFWSSFKELMPENVLLKAADRGYFGGIFEPEFSDSSASKVLLLHSFGLHWCPKDKFTQADHIVVLNGFETFHPKDRKAKSRSKKILKSMISEFKKNPEKVLKAFYKNCFHPGEKDHASLNWMNNSRLADDLTLMNKSKLKLNRTKAQWVVVDSGKDRIISGSRGAELAEMSSTEFYKSFEDAGHGLPLLNSSDCWSYLCEVIPIFKKYEYSH